MTVGTLALTCLWLAVGQAPPASTSAAPAPAVESLHFARRDLKIPVSVAQDARRAEITELRLFATADQGKSWHQVGSVSPEKEFFPYYAPRDGTYGLRVALVRQGSRQEPADPGAGPPDLLVVIDTQKPKVQAFEAKAQGDEVAVAWDIQEDHPDGASFRIEYQPRGAAAEAWTAAPIGRPALSGQDRFRPAVAGPLAVRLTLRDQAGNQSYAFAEVSPGGTQVAAAYPPPAAAPAPTAAVPPTLAAEIAVPTAPKATPTPELPAVGSITPPAAPPPLGRETVSQSLSPRPPEPPTPGNAALPESPRPTPPAPAVTATQVPPAVAPPAGLGSAPATAAVPPAGEEGPKDKVIADSRWTPAPAPAPKAPPVMEKTSYRAEAPPTPAAEAPRRPLPAIRYVSQPNVVIEMALSKVGSSGQGTATLYCTPDDGQTWAQHSKLALTGVTPGQRQKTVVTLARPRDGVSEIEEGVYGFTVVLRNPAGFGRPAPKAGDAPEVRFELDKTPPVAELKNPLPDPAKAGSILLRWNAADKNLGKGPVSLDWAEELGKEWHPIARGLAHESGQHSWQPPAKMPVRVHLRLRVRDEAGNESVATTQEPQFVDLSEPEGHLVSEDAEPQPR